MILLNPSGAPPLVRPVAGFDFRVETGPWRFAEQHGEEIAGHWEQARAMNPSLFDGAVLVAPEFAIADGVARASFVEIQFSALLYWRSLGFPMTAGGFNVFGSAVVTSRDGAVLLALMSERTANAGRIYFPAGTPDPSDVGNGRLDIQASMLRELEEETGIGPDLARPTEQRWTVADGPLVSCARRIDVDLDGEELVARVRGFLAAEKEPELADAILVRSMADVDRVRVPAYAQALLQDLV